MPPLTMRWRDNGVYHGWFGLSKVSPSSRSDNSITTQNAYEWAKFGGNGAAAKHEAFSTMALRWRFWR